MSKNKPRQAGSPNTGLASLARLRRALLRCKKAELVDTLLELARADRGVLRQLTARLDMVAAPDELVAGTHQAIADATAFDERDINRNFAYDYEAYEEVKRNLSRLVEARQLRAAMRLALGLMSQGSHQVEMSDEGLMTRDIEDCLRVVLQALEKCRSASCLRRKSSPGVRRCSPTIALASLPGRPLSRCEPTRKWLRDDNKPRGRALQRELTIAQHSHRVSPRHLLQRYPVPRSSRHRRFKFFHTCRKDTFRSGSFL
jgi:hypothetical protein